MKLCFLKKLNKQKTFFFLFCISTLGTGHVADIYSPAVTDSPALQEARVKIVAYLNDLLDGQLDETSSTSTGSTSSLKEEIGNLGNVMTDISKEQNNVDSSIVSLPSIKLPENSQAPALQEQGQDQLPQLKSFTFGLGDALLGNDQETENRGSGLLGDLNLGNIFESPNEQSPNQFNQPQQIPQQQFILPSLQQPQSLPTLPAQPSQTPTRAQPTQSNTIIPPTSYTPPPNSDNIPIPSSSPKTNSVPSTPPPPPPSSEPEPILNITLSVLSANTLSQSSATSSSNTAVNATPVAITPSESEFYNQNMDQDPGVLTPDRDSNDIAAENAKINAILNPKKPVKPLDTAELEGKNSIDILNLIDIHGKQHKQKTHKKHHYITVNNKTTETTIKQPTPTNNNYAKKLTSFTDNAPLGNLPNFPTPQTNVAPMYAISNGPHKIIIESHSTTYPQLVFAKNDAFSVESTDLSKVQLPSFISSSISGTY